MSCSVNGITELLFLETQRKGSMDLSQIPSVSKQKSGTPELLVPLFSSIPAKTTTYDLAIVFRLVLE